MMPNARKRAGFITLVSVITITSAAFVYTLEVAPQTEAVSSNRSTHIELEHGSIRVRNRFGELELSAGQAILSAETAPQRYNPPLRAQPVPPQILWDDLRQGLTLDRAAVRWYREGPEVYRGQSLDRRYTCKLIGGSLFIEGEGRSSKYNAEIWTHHLPALTISIDIRGRCELKFADGSRQQLQATPPLHLSAIHFDWIAKHALELPPENERWRLGIDTDKSHVAELFAKKVHPFSPAEKAGVQSGDILIGIAEYRSITLEKIPRVLKEHPRNTTLKLFVLRDGQELNLIAQHGHWGL